MKILLVANYLPDKQESMQRFSDLLVETLKTYNHQVKVIRPIPKINRAHASYEEKGKWWGYIDKFLIFPIQLKKQTKWADVTHICDHSNAYYVNFIQHQAHVITCHDLIAIRAALDPEDQKIKRSGKILQSLILSGLKKARIFACVSGNTREELLKVAEVTPEKATIVYNGINYAYQPMSNDQVDAMLENLKLEGSFPDFGNKSFILHVGGNQPYKNRMGVLRIYHQLCAFDDRMVTPQLAMVGKPWTDEMREFVAKNDLQDSVVEIQNCSNEEMRALYSRARAFLFPSLAEGFGWPVIEAQACGCPVLTSNFAPLTEIGGDAAIYCDPRDEKEAALRLKELLNEDDNARNARILSGLKNVERFTPQTMIEGYLALYRKSIESRVSTSK